MRRAAVAVLAGSVGAGLLSARSRTAARLLQLGAGASVVYAGYLARSGGRMMRAARAGDSSVMAAGRTGGPAPDRDGWAPFVSVVVPAKNEAPVIAEIVRDLAAQRYVLDGAAGYEAIVVDDGSSDGTGALAREAAQGSDGRVRVIRREPGSGAATRGAVLNFALERARGEVLVAIDADSRVATDFVERSILAWRRDPSAAALQVQKRPVNPETNWLTRAQAEELLLDMSSQCGRWMAGGTGELRGNGMFIRRDVVERLGGWGDHALTEDLDMSTRLAAAGERVTLAPDVAVGEQALEEFRPLWHQRMRWAEGSLRRFISHGPSVLKAPLPRSRKLDQTAYMTIESALPPFLASAFLAQALYSGRRRTGWGVPARLVGSYASALVLFALTGLAADGRRGLPLLAGALRGSAFLTHWLLVVPAALIRIAVRPADITYVKTPRLAPRTAPPPQHLAQQNEYGRDGPRTS